ncbi:MAG: phospholipase D-like domain-containing protein [Aggregatilineales bacterium]
MTKKSSKKQSPLETIIGAILGLIVLIAGFLIYNTTGVDLLDVINDDTAGNDTTVSAPVALPGTVEGITFEQGSGGRKGFWAVYFTAPTNTRDRSQYKNGVDSALAAAIDGVRNTLDIAAFELNNEVITAAILRAHERGVTVRVVTDDEHGLEDDDSTLIELEAEDIPIVDDSRSALMHNKFMIMDGITLWMGSMNYTVNGAYRNNNNMVSLRSRRAVEAYQEEFNEMFERGEFGPRSSEGNNRVFSQDGTGMEIHFASEDNVIDELLSEINNAQREIRFMTFSFTRDDLGEALLARSQAGVDVQGVFETTGSETQFSEMPRLLCAGLDVRQDGNRGILHHKVFVIDQQTVITGSFNYSNNAVESNDENVLIIRDPDLAQMYLAEFARVQNIASRADDIPCN